MRRIKKGSNKNKTFSQMITNKNRWVETNSR